MTEIELNELIALEKKASKHPWKTLGSVSIMGRRKGIAVTTPKNMKAQADIEFIVAMRNSFSDIVEILRQHVVKQGEVK